MTTPIVQATEFKEEIAVFGGSFDPPHLAHALVVASVLSLTDVARVLVVPTFEHPFGKALTPFSHRLAMCELAFADLRRVELSGIERELGGPSYTLRMLEALQARHPSARLRFVIGADVLADKARWRDFERIESLAPLIVLGRAGHAVPDGAMIVLPDISSTAARARVQAGQGLAEVVSPRVERYIAAHGLYREHAS